MSEASEQRPLRILSLGAGVQSTTLLLMSLRGELPRLDHAIFADTHAEPAPVYRHLEWIKGECAAAGVPLHIVSAGNLRRDAIAFRRDRYNVDPSTGRKGYASIPLFVLNPGGSAGTAGRIRRQCTGEYKINPVETFIRRELLGIPKGRPAPRRVLVEQWLGITYDEARRARVPSGGKRRDAISGESKPAPIWWKTHAYPLMGVQKFWGMSDGGLWGKPQPLPLQSPWSHDGVSLLLDRADCITWLERNYPTIRVPRSACTFCPYRSNREWKQMRAEDPASFADACDFDDAIRSADEEGQHAKGMLVGKPFVHRSCVPLRDVDFDASTSTASVPEVDEAGQMIFGEAAESECEGMCGV